MFDALIYYFGASHQYSKINRFNSKIKKNSSQNKD